MAQLLVRNIDDHVVERLKATAAKHHRSLEAEVRCVLQEHTQHSQTSDNYLERLATLRAAILTENGGKPFSDSAELIREDRER
jgi:hypothetical protein